MFKIFSIVVVIYFVIYTLCPGLVKTGQAIFRDTTRTTVFNGIDSTVGISNGTIGLNNALGKPCNLYKIDPVQRDLPTSILLISGSTRKGIDDIAIKEQFKDFLLVSNMPNLCPYKPVDMPYEIMISFIPGSNFDVSAIHSNENIYISWAVTNNGKTATLETFYTALLIDGVEKGRWCTNPPLQPGEYACVKDVNIGKLSVGHHIFKILIDVTGTIDEGNEMDNEFASYCNVTNSE